MNFALDGLENRVTNGEVNLTVATLRKAEFGSFWCCGEKVFKDLTMTLCNLKTLKTKLSRHRCVEIDLGGRYLLRFLFTTYAVRTW